MTRYLIIGTGVASLAAMEAIREVDAGGELTVVGDDPHGYYSRPGLAYYLTSEITEALLRPYQPEAYNRLRARTVQGHVTRILAGEHEVEIDGSMWVPYDRLLIATGASALPLDVPGADLDGVMKLDHLEDAKRIVKRARRSRTAIVLGGGITALELVEGLKARHLRVHYLLRGERYWASVLDAAESRIVEQRLQKEGVVLHYRTEVAEVLGRKSLFGRRSKVAGVRTTAGQVMKCDLLVYAVGIAPKISLAQEAGIACDRGILTDVNMQTNLPDVFAAGDVAQVFDPASGAAVLDSLWGPARQQGRTAGLNMAGQPAVYTKPTPFNVTRLAGLTTTIIGRVGMGRDPDLLGIARGDSETWRQRPDAIIAQTGFDVNRLRIMVGEKVLLGAIVMGDQGLSSPLETLIRDRVDISAIRDRLLEPGAQVADILGGFWAARGLPHAA